MSEEELKLKRTYSQNQGHVSAFSSFPQVSFAVLFMSVMDSEGACSSAVQMYQENI